jgi:hypothetical protein
MLVPALVESLMDLIAHNILLRRINRHTKSARPPRRHRDRIGEMTGGLSFAGYNGHAAVLIRGLNYDAEEVRKYGQRAAHVYRRNLTR